MATASKAVRADDGSGLNIRTLVINESAEDRHIQSVAISDGDDGTPVDVVGEAALPKGLTAYGSDGTSSRAIRTTAAGVTQVDGSGVTQPVSAASLPLPTGAATAALQLPDGHNVTVDNAAGAAAVNIQDGGNAITVDGTVVANAGTGTFAISAATLPLPTGAATAALQLPDSHNVTVDNAAGAAAVNIQDGGNAITVDGSVTAVSGTATNLKAEVVGSVADDSPTPGNPITVAGLAVSPDGTDPGSVAEADVARLRTDLNRRLLVNIAHPNLWSYHENSSSALTDQAVAAAPGVGFSLFVTDIVFSTGAATVCNIFFEEGVTTVLGPYYLEAVAGRGVALHFVTPKKITTNTALTVTTSAAIAHGLDVHGFIAAV